MRSSITLIPVLSSVAILSAHGQTGEGYTNFIRQIQFHEDIGANITTSFDIPSEGQSLSQHSVEAGGSHFQLWTVKADPYTEYLLDTKYVGTHVPAAEIAIVTWLPKLCPLMGCFCDDPSLHSRT